MGYYIDFSKVNLTDYKKRLMAVQLVPSRMLLRDNIALKFDKLALQGISNIDELISALKTPKNLAALASASDIEEDYLKILKREINSTIPKPNKFQDFPNIKPETVAVLNEADIKNTTQLYDRIISAKTRKAFESVTGLSPKTVIKLAKLTDLSRVQWVNHTFAWMLYELGYDTVEKLSAAEAIQLHKDLNTFNAVHEIYHHPFGINDIHRVIFAAKEIPLEVEY